MGGDESKPAADSPVTTSRQVPLPLNGVSLESDIDDIVDAPNSSPAPKRKVHAVHVARMTAAEQAPLSGNSGGAPGAPMLTTATLYYEFLPMVLWVACSHRSCQVLAVTFALFMATIIGYVTGLSSRQTMCDGLVAQN
jgi:hypothetical protein